MFFYITSYIVYNGLGDLFVYAPTMSTNVSINIKRRPAIISYSYVVNQKEYSSEQEVAPNVAEKIVITELTIMYNQSFPAISQIGGLSGNSSKLNECVWKMDLSAIGFLFAFLIYRFANHSKWITIYSGEKLESI